MTTLAGAGGNRISASTAARTFVVLDLAGLTRAALAGAVPSERLVVLRDRSSCTRYDFRTRTGLQALASALVNLQALASALVKLSLVHHVGPDLCPDRAGCRVLTRRLLQRETR